MTLAAAIEALDSEDRGLTFIEGDLRTALSFAAVRESAREIAGGLRAAGLEPGDRVVIVLPRQLDFAQVFLGAVRGGFVPVPLYPPLGAGQADAFVASVRRVLELTGARAIVSIDVLNELLAVAAAGARLLTPEDCRRGAGPGPLRAGRSDDPVFIQFTSGSTADPRGVVVTNRSLGANASMIVSHLRADAGRDRAVSWLPMYHDMGLIGFVLVPVLEQIPVWYLPPLEFARRPQRWFELIDEVRGTIAFAPNFGYALAARKLTREDVERWDLSCWRVAGCGAEPVNPSALREFAARLARAGFDARALLPCYGMAEATLAVTLSPLGAGLRTLRADDGREIVSCGTAGPGHEVDVADSDGQSLPEGVEGEIVFKGPSLAAGYYGDAEATRLAFRDDRLHTGDTGFRADGELYVTGRMKDLIIVRGRNYHPHDIELAAASVHGVRAGGAVAFARGGVDGTDEVVVMVEASGDEHPDAVEAAVRKRVHRDFGLVVGEAVVVERGALPRTSSGKLRRSAAAVAPADRKRSKGPSCATDRL